MPWSEIDELLRNEMAQHVHEMLAFDEDGNAVVPPSRRVILRRIKRYYRSQRQQQVTKADQEKRRRKRFINRRNRLTMVTMPYFCIVNIIILRAWIISSNIDIIDHVFFLCIYLFIFIIIAEFFMADTEVLVLIYVFKYWCLVLSK